MWNADFSEAYTSAIGEVSNIRLLINELDVTSLDSLDLDVMDDNVGLIVDSEIKGIEFELRGHKFRI